MDDRDEARPWEELRLSLSVLHCHDLNLCLFVTMPESLQVPHAPIILRMDLIIKSCKVLTSLTLLPCLKIFVLHLGGRYKSLGTHPSTMIVIEA